MVKQSEPSTPGSVSGELLGLVNGSRPKSRWVRGGMFASGVAAPLVSDLLGWPWRQNKGLLILGVAAVWFVIALVIAFRESRSADESLQR